MAAVLIGQVAVKNENLWQEYVAGVDLSLVPFQAHANIHFRGEKTAVLAGTNLAERVVVIEFESVDIANRWFCSACYQSLISLRDQAATDDITLYNETASNRE